MMGEMRSVGRYAVERQLGAGAFATVWLGRDDELDVPVAVKVLAENWSQNADVRRRFVDEARVLRRIQDPRIVRVYDIGTLPDGRSFFVMDYADAGTLAELVLRRPDLETALTMAAEVARAVQVLHDHGVLHRDIKPSNLLLRHRGDGTQQLMVADLGTAKTLAAASGLTLVAGTPAYMAPEQAHGQQALDERCDVYGVAAVAYTLVSGRPPFPTPGGAPDVAFREPDLHPDPLPTGLEAAGPLTGILRAALAFDPEKRPRTAARFAEQLESLLDQVRSDPSVAVRVRASTPARPTVHVLLGLALAIVVVVAALTWLVLGLLA